MCLLQATDSTIQSVKTTFVSSAKFRIDGMGPQISAFCPPQHNGDLIHTMLLVAMIPF